MRPLVILNPRSSNGATGRRWGRVEAALREVLGPIEVERTRAPRDAERIAREGVRAGVSRIIVAGGDGTVSEIATGLLSADLAGYVELGLLPLGTGGDLLRTLGVPAQLESAIAHLAEWKSQRIDAGRVVLGGADRAARTRYFLNIASIGVSADITREVNRAGKALGGRVAFLLGTVRGVLRMQAPPATLRIDGEPVHEGPLVLAAAANGRYFGGGMHVAPGARPDDAELDVVVIGDLGRAQLLAKLATIYRGTHLEVPGVSLHRGRVIEVEAPADSLGLEADGEELGWAPARIELLPAAISVVAPTVAADPSPRA